MCVRIELVAPEPHEVRPCYRGATRMPSTVGTTSESESWLIADVPLDNGFRLELGAVATDRECRCIDPEFSTGCN